MTEFVTVPKAGMVDACLDLYKKWQKHPEDKRYPDYLGFTIKGTCADVYAIADAILDKKVSINKIIEVWDAYQNDMRPETRNEFLRAFKEYRDGL